MTSPAPTPDSSDYTPPPPLYTPPEFEDPSLGPFAHHPHGTLDLARSDHFILDGVNRNLLIWDDPMGSAFPRPWMIVLFNMAVAAVLNFFCFCHMAIPGSPVRALLVHLRLEARPATTDFLWDYLVRFADKLPVGTVTFWVTLAAATCGVLAVGLFTCILLRVGYLVRNECAPGSLRREAMARRLSALTGGLFLAISPSMLVASSRTLPTTFSFLFLLTVVWFFSAFQHGGRRWRLALFAFDLGLCCAAFSTAWAFAPLLLVLALMEAVRWRILRSVRTWLALVLPFLLGLSLLLPEALLLFRRGHWIDLYATFSDALLGLLRAQFHALLGGHFTVSFLLFGCILILPWCTLFLTRRSPWFHEWPQISLRLLFAGGGLCILFNAMFAPYYLVPGGLDDPGLVPSAILALCFGYIAGEFWCLGQPQPLVDRLVRHRLRRHAATVLAVLLPLGTLAAIPHNVPLARVPSGLWSAHIAEHLLDTRGSRDAFLLEAPLDDILLLVAHERHAPVFIFSASRFYDPLYQRLLANRFDPDSDIARSLRAGQFENALRYWLDDDQFLSITIAAIRPELLYEYAFLLPDAIAYTTHASPDEVAPAVLPAVISAQLPFWQTIAESAAATSLPPANPFARYHAFLLATAAATANNAGVLCSRAAAALTPSASASPARPSASARLLPLADTLFALATQMNSNNVSARMNALHAAETLRPDDPATHAERARWDRDIWTLGGARWALGFRFGYLYDPEAWMREGHVWALSGAPLVAPAARRLPPLAVAADGTFSHFIDQAFIAYANPQNHEAAYRFQLVRDPWNAPAILELCRLALRDKQPDVADAYIDEAVASTGLDEADVLFERTLVDFVRLRLHFDSAATAGAISVADYARFPAPPPPAEPVLAAARVRAPELWTAPDGTLRSPHDVFLAISRRTVHDMRVWMTLYLLANGAQPESEAIEKTLKNSRPNDLDVWATLASIHLDRNDLRKARDELNHALALAIDRPALWELALTIAERTGNARLAVAAEKQLITIAPFHFLVFQAAGRRAYERGDLDEAIRIFRRGIFLERNPVLLNNLAHVLAEKDVANADQAILLVDEAIKRDPSQPRFLNTRASILLAAGRPVEALPDMQKRFRAGLLTWSEYILLADIYRALGDPAHVASTIKKARLTLQTPPPRPAQSHVISLELYASGQ